MTSQWPHGTLLGTSCLTYMWHAAVLRAYSKISVPSATQVEDGDLGIMTNAALWMRRLLSVEPMSWHSYVHEPLNPYSVTSCFDVTQAMESGPSSAAAATTSKMYGGQEDGQVAWPTPSAAVCRHIQTVVKRILITLQWLVAYLQNNPGEAERAATLFALLVQICHQLLMGHMVDCQLKITELLWSGAVPLLSTFFDTKRLTRPMSHKDQHTCILLEELVGLFLKQMATDQEFLAEELNCTVKGRVAAFVGWVANGFGKPCFCACDRMMMHTFLCTAKATTYMKLPCCKVCCRATS